MKPATRGTALAPLRVSGAADHQEIIALLNSLKAARGKGLNLDAAPNFPPNASDLDDGSDSKKRPLSGISMCETANHQPHTIDHINCPGCQALDELMKADLLGMANQTFPDAAKVGQRLRRNSNALRSRTHEGVDEYIAALKKLFKSIVMRSVNPGMVKAYRTGRMRTSNVVAFTSLAAEVTRQNHGNCQANQEAQIPTLKPLHIRPPRICAHLDSLYSRLHGICPDHDSSALQYRAKLFNSSICEHSAHLLLVQNRMNKQSASGSIL